MAIVYGIPNCATVKAARDQLEASSVQYEFWDFKKLGVPTENLNRWIHDAGRDIVLNRRGTTWRKLDEAQRESVHDDDSAAELLTEYPSMIKRPVVEWPDGRLTIGFTKGTFSEVRP